MMVKQAIPFFITSFLMFVFVSSCKNEEEQIPAFIQIDSINVIKITTDSSITYSHKITDAWVTIDGKQLGVYELPARFPVLYEGEHTLSVGAGIKDNGISSARADYIFYNNAKSTVQLIPGQTTLVSPHPTVNYIEGIHYPFSENFEGNTLKFTNTSSSPSLLEIIQTGIFEGFKSAKFTLTTDKSSFDGEATSGFEIENPREVYLELNYKAEQPFNIGVEVNDNGSASRKYVLTINETDYWNKIYIKLSEVIGQNRNADDFRIYIDASLQSGLSQASIYLDNFQVIHN